MHSLPVGSAIIHVMETICGTAVKQDGNGARIGYPTANIAAPLDVKDGVYAGTVTMGGADFYAMIFIGEPITLEQKNRRAEAHILDFPARDLYGEQLCFALQKFVRPNKKFTSTEELIAAIQDDEKLIRNYFKLGS